MDNYVPDNTARRYIAHVSVLGTTQIHLRSPSVIAWWSAAFPGFGHLLLSKYIRGFVLFIWEVIVNVQANVNSAIIYTFQGNFDMATNVLDTRWLLVYLPVYFFGIWDSHRTTVDMNKVYVLTEHEEHRFNIFSMGHWKLIIWIREALLWQHFGRLLYQVWANSISIELRQLSLLSSGLFSFFTSPMRSKLFSFC
ncbi:hypothetical protein [Virgibacillus saliphilus]|uniref:hypothetical protein n=1 Tax=Virgibacillus saliphilus TaxID=2831674 RepID=UPI002815002A|nr:hypothetical protein [Virgibacillus sp. NKC19-3]